MTRFTVAAGEGPSRPKRLRLCRELSHITGVEEEEEEGGETSDEEEDQDRNFDYDGQREETSDEEEDQDRNFDYDGQREETSNEEEDEDRNFDRDGQLEDAGNGGRQQEQQQPVTLTLTDPEALDCSICFEPLTIPVFQCENGHIACSPCCGKLAQKCPSCSLPIGYNRCRAIEKVLEAVKIPCENNKFGCRESFSYSKKCDHDKICNYAACLCPMAGCSFVSSYKRLHVHVSSRHKASVSRFKFNVSFPVFFLASGGPTGILQEETQGIVFILNNRVESLGNVVTVKCIAPTSAKGAYFYDLTAKGIGSNLKLQSFTKSTRNLVDHSPSGDFLLVPKDFCGSYALINIDLCIWPWGSYPVGVSCPENLQRSSPALCYV